MSAEVVRELFRNLENTLHDRLKVIEDILSSTKHSNQIGDSSGVETKLARLESYLQSVEEYAMGEVRSLAYNHDMLEKRVNDIETQMKYTLTDLMRRIDDFTKSVGVKKVVDEIPVEVAEVEAEIEEAQEAALNVDEDATVTEMKAKKALAKAVEQLEEETTTVEEEEEQEEQEEEEVEEEEEQEVEEEEEEVEEEQEEEVEELDLEEFEYEVDGKTYYRDQEMNVYIADEDGCVDPNEVVGIWNPKKRRIQRVPKA